MRSLIVVVGLFACKSKAPPAPESLDPPPPAPIVASASDGGSALADDPAWAHDPPDVLRDKITAVNAHIIVLKSGPEFPEWRDVLATVEKTPGVIAAEPFIFAELQIAAHGKPPIGVAIKGVDPGRVDRVLGFGKRMTTGTLAALAATPPAVVLGDDLAKQLGVQVGDEVTVETALGRQYDAMDWYELNKPLFTALFGDRRP